MGMFSNLFSSTTLNRSTLPIRSAASHGLAQTVVGGVTALVAAPFVALGKAFGVEQRPDGVQPRPGPYSAGEVNGMINRPGGVGYRDNRLGPRPGEEPMLTAQQVAIQVRNGKLSGHDAQKMINEGKVRLPDIRTVDTQDPVLVEDRSIRVGGAAPSTPTSDGLAMNPVERGLRDKEAVAEKKLLSSLTPEQKELYRDFKSKELYMPTYDDQGKKIMYGRYISLEERGAASEAKDEFEKSLSKEQRKLLDDYIQKRFQADHWPEKSGPAFGEAAVQTFPIKSQGTIETRPLDEAPKAAKAAGVAAKEFGEVGTNPPAKMVVEGQIVGGTAFQPQLQGTALYSLANGDDKGLFNQDTYREALKQIARLDMNGPA